MKISRVGGVIAAASRKVAMPLMCVGTIPVIRRIVISYQQSGIFPIVIITGQEDEEIKQQLASYGVIFLKNPEDEQPELFSSVKIGLSYLQGKCDYVAFTPVNIPMFTPMTLNLLMQQEGKVIRPSCEGKAGHPVLLSEELIPELLAFREEGGLREALRRCPAPVWVEVKDRGIYTSVYNSQELRAQLKVHNTAILHPVLHMQLEQEEAFCNNRLKLLLFLIDDLHNMRSCCDCSGISYSKAWDMINRLEQTLGYQIVERRRGGQSGGSTCLSERGRIFLREYQRFEENIRKITQEDFKKRFIFTKIIG